MLAPTPKERLRALAFLILGALVVTVTLLIVLRVPFQKDDVRYVARFRSSVLGIGAGSQVLYKGVRVGEVAAFRLADDGSDDVLVVLEVQREAPIYKDGTSARISTASLVGPLAIELSTEPGAKVRASPGDEIPGLPSSMMRILDSGSEVGEQLPVLVGNLERLTGEPMRARLETFADSTTAVTKRLPATLDRVDRLLTTYDELGRAAFEFLEAERPRLQRILANLEALSLELRRIGEDRVLVEALISARNALDTAANELEKTSEEVRRFLRAPVFPQLDGALADLTTATRRLDRLLATAESEGVGLLRSDLAPLLSSLQRSSEDLGEIARVLRADPSLILLAQPATEVPLPRGGPKEKR